jgi:sulfur-oxidizing protein SoxX
MKPIRSRCFALACLFTVAGSGFCSDAESPNIQAGRNLAYDFNKGNCLACHSAPTDERAVTLANMAPPLLMIRKRFPDRKMLRAQIWDPTLANPNTIMPPFGKHRILSAEEIDLIIDYLYTL